MTNNLKHEQELLEALQRLKIVLLEIAHDKIVCSNQMHDYYEKEAYSLDPFIRRSRCKILLTIIPLTWKQKLWLKYLNFKDK